MQLSWHVHAWVQGRPLRTHARTASCLTQSFAASAYKFHHRMSRWSLVSPVEFHLALFSAVSYCHWEPDTFASVSLTCLLVQSTLAFLKTRSHFPSLVYRKARDWAVIHQWLAPFLKLNPTMPPFVLVLLFGDCSIVWSTGIYESVWVVARWTPGSPFSKRVFVSGWLSGSIIMCAKYTGR